MAMPLIKNILNKILNLEKMNNYNDAIILADKTKIKTITPLVGSNYSGYGNSFYYKIGSKVHVHIGLRDLTANTVNNVATLPEGYRPNTSIAILGYSYSATSIIAGTIYSVGKIEINPQNAPFATFDVEYDVFN